MVSLDSIKNNFKMNTNVFSLLLFIWVIITVIIILFFIITDRSKVIIDVTLISVIIFLILLGLILKLGYRRVDEGKVALVERMGNYNRPLSSGPNWIIPFVEDLAWVKIGKHRVQYIDLREQTHDIKAQNVITKDKTPVTIDTILFWRIDKVKGAEKVAYQLRNVVEEIDRLVHTSIRDMVADIPHDKMFSEAREKIMERLFEYMKEDSERWGIEIVKIYVEDIKPTEDMKKAMEERSIAEKVRDKKRIEKEAKIIEAEGKREARVIEAEAEAESIRAVFRAIKEENPDNNLIAIRYLDALQKIAEGKANKVFMPFEATNLLSSLGAIKELDKNSITKIEKEINENDSDDFNIDLNDNVEENPTE